MSTYRIDLKAYKFEMRVFKISLAAVYAKLRSHKGRTEVRISASGLQHRTTTTSYTTVCRRVAAAPSGCNNVFRGNFDNFLKYACILFGFYTPYSMSHTPLCALCRPQF